MEIPFYPGATCYLCGCGNAERRLYPTVDERLWVCRPCDSGIKRNRNFKAVAEGLKQLREFEVAEPEQDT